MREHVAEVAASPTAAAGALSSPRKLSDDEFARGRCRAGLRPLRGTRQPDLRPFARGRPDSGELARTAAWNGGPSPRPRRPYDGEHYDRFVLVTYSQNREDLYLYALLGDGPGFYVDVGANHPQKDSVTKFFSERGWRGINVEPNVHLASLLELDRPNDLTLNIGLADCVGTMSFRLFTQAPGLSTFDEHLKERRAADGLEYLDIEVPVSTLEAVFQDHPVGTVDFLKVDAEGFETAVLRGNDWTSVRPRVVVLEGGDQSTWSRYLTDRAYTQEFFDGLNFYFVAEEHRSEITIFKFAERVLSDAVIPFFAAEQLRDLEREIESNRLNGPATPVSSTEHGYQRTDAGIWRRAAAAASRLRR
jgi:FkbM family methyltransferase